MPKIIAFKSSELIDLDAAKIIRDNWDEIDIPEESKQPWTVNENTYDPRAILDKIISKTTKQSNGYGILQTQYSFSSILKKFGRRFVDQSLGMQSISRYIRHTLCHKQYNDIDVVNCHPTILVQYCSNKGWACEHIQYYVDNREELLKDFAIMGYDKGDVKQMINSMINNGYKKYEDFCTKQSPPKWLRNFAKQMPQIHSLMLNDLENKELIKLIVKANKKNIEGSLCNCLLCGIEDNILMEVVNYLKKKKIPIDKLSLAFDGLMILKEVININDKVLQEISDFVKEKTGYCMKFIVKPMDCIINLDGFESKEEESEYDIMKKKFEERVCMIKDPVCFGYLRDDGDYTFVDRSKLMTMFEDWRYNEKTKGGDLNEVSFTSQWLQDPNKRKYEKFVVDPSFTCPSNYLNVFPEFVANKYDPIPDEEVESLVDMIVQHFKDLMQEKEFKYIFDWMANIVQNPHKPTKTAILLKGEQGAGKDIVFDWFREEILGAKISYQTADPDDLLGRFANGCHNKIFVVVDEANGKDFFGKNETLKNLITSKNINYEVKGVMKISETSFVNLLFTTNNMNPINISSDDRRFLIVLVRSVHKGDSDYFIQLAKHMERDDVKRAFYQYLKNRDISHIKSFQDDRPITKAYRECQTLSLSPFHNFMSYVSDSSDREIETQQHGVEFFERFKAWSDQRNIKQDMNITSFGIKIKEFIPGETSNMHDSSGVVKKRRTKGMYYEIDKEALQQSLRKRNLYNPDIM